MPRVVPDHPRMLQVLTALVADPARRHHGAELVAEINLSFGTVDALLARLEAVRWVDSGWESPNSTEQGWPRRRYYRLTPEGKALARGALASRTAVPAGGYRLRPAGGVT